jgi:hypothetical protein
MLTPEYLAQVRNRIIHMLWRSLTWSSSNFHASILTYIPLIGLVALFAFVAKSLELIDLGRLLGDSNNNHGQFEGHRGYVAIVEEGLGLRRFWRGI